MMDSSMPAATHAAVTQMTGAGQGSAGVPPLQVTGPVSGGARGWPLGSFPGDLAGLGYVEEEYFIEGTATAYRAVGEWGRDGRWQVEPAGTQPFRIRILVHKPMAPERFNGTALVEWINVSPGYDNMIVPDEPIYDGFAYVGVSAQYVGVHGFDYQPADRRLGLTQWDGERYGTLAHPGDPYSFDIFTQAARVLRGQAQGPHPLAGLGVTRLIATGASQSAARLRTYINAIHPRDRAYDAYLPFLDYGNALDLDNIFYREELPEPELIAVYWRLPVRVREDLDVPVMVVNSEQESFDFRGPERGFLLQPDSDKFRLWEVPGASHSPELPSDQVTRAAYGERDGLRRSTLPPGTLPGSHVTCWDATMAAYYHVHRWLNGGGAPPSQPRIRYREGGRVELIRDEYGIGTGGIRLPETDVPIEMNTGLPQQPITIRNRGLSEPFTAERLQALYPTHEDYVRRVTHAAQAAERAGVILPSRTRRYIAEAAAAAVP